MTREELMGHRTRVLPYLDQRMPRGEQWILTVFYTRDLGIVTFNLAGWCRSSRMEVTEQLLRYGVPAGLYDEIARGLYLRLDDPANTEYGMMPHRATTTRYDTIPRLPLEYIVTPHGEWT